MLRHAHGEKKRLIIGKYMAGDIEALAILLKSISSQDRHAADITLYGLKSALVEVLTFSLSIAATSATTNFGVQDRRWLTMAIAAGQGRQCRIAARVEFYRTIFVARL